MVNNLLITILCSSKKEILDKSILSVVNQINAQINYDIVIIVNTLDNQYYNEIVDLYSGKYKIIRTESNGRPGKGHNSCISTFNNLRKYDSLFIIIISNHKFDHIIINSHMKYNQ